MLRIVRGKPSDDELAALIVVITALADGVAGADGAAAEPTTPRTAWADPAPRLRTPLHHPGPGAWRHSALPAPWRIP